MAKFSCNVISYTLRRAIDLTVVIPTPAFPETSWLSGSAPTCRHTPKTKYPVVYLLHGIGNNHATWTGYTNVEMYAEERRIALVCISAENKPYITKGDDDFFTFISQELPDFVCGLFPVSERPEDTYIAGLSMGGFGTLVHALSTPERFAAFGTFSAAPRLMLPGVSFDEMLSDEADAKVELPQFDPKMLAKKLAAAGKQFPKAYLSCGGKDGLFESNRQFRDLLISLGADVTWDEIPQYGHEWRFWDIEVEKFLDWIPRTDDYAKMGKRKI